MLRGFIILLFLQLVGDVISTGFDLPIPGPVIGMILLLLLLILKGQVPEDLGKTSDGLTSHIGLFFVPAGAGVSLYLDMIGAQWPMIVVASLTSTVLTLLLSAFIFQKLAGR